MRIAWLKEEDANTRFFPLLHVGEDESEWHSQYSGCGWRLWRKSGADSYFKDMLGDVDVEEDGDRFVE